MEQTLKKIPRHQLKLDLFNLDPLIDKNYSNTLEIYDILGKYVYEKTAKYFKSATAEQTRLIRSTAYNGITIKIILTAATIERPTQIIGIHQISPHNCSRQSPG